MSNYLSVKGKEKPEEKFVSNYLSVKGKKKLEEKRKRLIEKKNEIFKGVKGARLKSDCSNTGLINDTRELQRINREIDDIDERLSRAKVIDPDRIETDKVRPGCEVTLFFLSMGDTKTFVVGIDDPDCNNNISLKSPLGKSIMGSKEEDIVRYSVNGEMKEVKVKNIT